MADNDLEFVQGLLIDFDPPEESFIEPTNTVSSNFL